MLTSEPSNSTSSRGIPFSFHWFTWGSGLGCVAPYGEVSFHFFSKRLLSAPPLCGALWVATLDTALPAGSLLQPPASSFLNDACQDPRPALCHPSHSLPACSTFNHNCFGSSNQTQRVSFSEKKYTQWLWSFNIFHPQQRLNRAGKKTCVILNS